MSLVRNRPNKGQIMAAQPGRVRVYQHDQAVAFQVEGQATMHHSPAVRRYAEQNLTVGTTALSVDLRRCSHMDSTFLGTLLFLKRLVERCDEGTFALISPSPQCRQLLREMGLEKIFAVVDGEELAPDTSGQNWQAGREIFRRSNAMSCRLTKSSVV